VVAGRRVALTPVEFRLLHHLMAHVGSPCTYGEILHSVWGYDDADEATVIVAHVWRLRRKIEADPVHPQHIVTVHGIPPVLAG
jgi:DNA-binding response OmpR family regulator